MIKGSDTVWWIIMAAFAFQAINAVTNDLWAIIQGTLFLIGAISVATIIVIHMVKEELGYDEKEENNG